MQNSATLSITPRAAYLYRRLGTRRKKKTPYLVEKFEDAENKYQVEAFITKAEYNKISKEIKEYGRSGKIKSILAAPNGYDSNDRRSYRIEGRESGFDRAETQHGRENSKMVRLDSEQAQGRERSSSNRSGDSEGGGTDRQGNNINDRHSFAGTRANTADHSLLSKAQEMLDNGYDSETVRKETGWFKGYDGKWRFEIDDSDVKISLHTNKKWDVLVSIR